MMTRHDFQAIADTIRTLDIHHYLTADVCISEQSNILSTRLAIAEKFADMLQSENPRLKRDMFLRACGV